MQSALAVGERIVWCCSECSDALERADYNAIADAVRESAVRDAVGRFKWTGSGHSQRQYGDEPCACCGVLVPGQRRAFIQPFELTQPAFPMTQEAAHEPRDSFATILRREERNELIVTLFGWLFIYIPFGFAALVILLKVLQWAWAIAKAI